jgi:Tfp pilus assembly protein PilF
VAEPFLDGAIRPDVLFPAYVSGMNLVESFYLAMPYLSWQSVVFGDPLCAPFRTENLSPEQAAPPVNLQSQLPEYFHRRRIAALVATGVAPTAAALILEGEALRKRGDEAGMKRVLEKATAADPGLNAAHLMLATAYEKEGAYDLAIERYRLVLSVTPGDPVAANNLAYALAVYKHVPAEALPIAEAAHANSRGEARIIDTLGWIHHLLGNAAEAGTLIAQAAAAAPTNAEIQLHLAFVQAVLGRSELALAALQKSLELDPTLANREDVKKLRADLSTR